MARKQTSPSEPASSPDTPAEGAPSLHDQLTDALADVTVASDGTVGADPSAEDQLPSTQADVAADPSAPPSDSPFSVREWARAQGLGALADAESDEAAVQSLVNYTRQIEPYANEYAQNYQTYHDWLAQQQHKQEPEAAAPVAPVDPYGAPAFDQAWLRWYDGVDEDGRPQFHAGCPPDVAMNLMKHLEFRQGFQQQFYANPAQALDRYFQVREQDVQRRIEEKINERLRDYDRHLALREKVQLNSDWIYARDANGNPVYNPVTGQMVYSPEGQRLTHYAQEAANMGIPEENRWAYALNMVSADVAREQLAAAGRAPTGAASSPAPTPNATGTPQRQVASADEANKTHFLRRQRKLTSTAGSINGMGRPGAPQQNDQLTWGEQLEQALRQAGFDGNNPPKF